MLDLFRKVHGRHKSNIPSPIMPAGAASFSATWTVASTGQLTAPIAALQGGVPAGSGVQIAGYPTQTDIKQTWGDGSLKYALLTANATSTGAKLLTVGSASGATFTPTAPTVTVTFTISAGAGSGQTYVATLGAYSGSDKWLSGDQAVEWRKVITPLDGATAHDNLRVRFDIRSYAAGGHRVDITVENCRDNANMTYSTYTAVIAIGGSTVYDTSTTDWPSGLKHWSFTAWRKVFTTSLTEAVATFDWTNFYDAKLLYRPMAAMVAKDWTADSRWNNAYYFGPLRFGMLDPKMGNVGNRCELSPYPQWDMEYLATQNAACLTIIRQHGESMAAWSGGRIWENDNATLYKADDGTHNGMTYRPQGSASYPTTLRATPEISGISFGPQYVGSRDDNDPALPVEEVWPHLDNEHPPDSAAVPAMVTGDRFYFDQLKHWANYWIMIALAGAGTYEGVPYGRDTGSYDAVIAWGAFRGTVRGWSRPFRTVLSAANLLPDADADKQYFVDAINDNLAYLSDYNTTRATTGDVYHDAALFWEDNANTEFYEYTPPSTVIRSVLYHQAFAEYEFAHSVWWANETGNFTVPSGALALVDRMLMPAVTVLASGSDTPLPRLLALNQYYPPVGERNGTPGATVTLVSGLSDWADRCVIDLTRIIQGAVEVHDLVCANSTTVTTASAPFTADWVGMRVGIGGLSGSDWLEDIFTAAYAQRIAKPGIYTIVSYNSSTSVTLDRKPVTNGTSETGGVLRSLNYSAYNAHNGVLVFNGPHTLLGLKVAVARGLTGAATALAYANAFRDGGISLADMITGTNGMGGYFMVGYGVELS